MTYKTEENPRLRNRFILIVYKKAPSFDDFDNWFAQSSDSHCFRHFVSVFLLPPWHSKTQNVLIGKVQEEPQRLSFSDMKTLIIKPIEQKGMHH